MRERETDREGVSVSVCYGWRCTSAREEGRCGKTEREGGRNRKGQRKTKVKERWTGVKGGQEEGGGKVRDGPADRRLESSSQ